MKRIRELIVSLTKKIAVLEEIIADQKKQLSDLNQKGEILTHSMEVREKRRVQTEERRQRALTDTDLRLALREQYGKTKWANKLIEEILQARIEKRELEESS